jgi:hypothetical protein
MSENFLSEMEIREILTWSADDVDVGRGADVLSAFSS